VIKIISAFFISLLFVSSSFASSEALNRNTKIVDLQTSDSDGGWFGATVGDSNGIEFVKSIPVHKDKEFRALVLQGAYCKITAGDTYSNDHVLDAGDQYGINSLGHNLDGTVLIHALNMYHKPYSFFIECENADDMTVGQVEMDLHWAIRFF
jgi:hypothetical protein